LAIQKGSENVCICSSAAQQLCQNAGHITLLPSATELTIQPANGQTTEGSPATSKKENRRLSYFLQTGI
jgi:hypothetical protein